MSGKKSDRKPYEKKTQPSRRSVLKAGVASIVLTPATIGAAARQGESNKERADRIHDTALEIRDRTGSKEKFKRFLQNNADKFVDKQMSFTPGSAIPDGPSVENWSEDAIETDLSLSYYTDSAGDEYANCHYDITVERGLGDHGEGGPDQMSISWADHHYRYVQDSEYYDPDMDNMGLKEESLNGVDWYWEDGKSCYYYCSTRDFYVGCQVKLLETVQERAVQASYWDVWDDAYVCGVSFSTSGDVSFQLCNEGRIDQYGFEIAEEGDVDT